jgi:hypothetical protein
MHRLQGRTESQLMCDLAQKVQAFLTLENFLERFLLLCGGLGVREVGVASTTFKGNSSIFA